jgi:hypothetical protein
MTEKANHLLALETIPIPIENSSILAKERTVIGLY